MKNLKKFLIPALILIFMSCRNEENTTSKNSSNTKQEYQSNSNVDDADNTSADDSKADEYVYGHTDYDRTRMKKLYEHLNLSADHIDQYERLSLKKRDAWTRTNPNTTLSGQQRMELEKESMKEFLNSKQYSSYQQWLNENPYQY